MLVKLIIQNCRALNFANKKIFKNKITNLPIQRNKTFKLTHARIKPDKTGYFQYFKIFTPRNFQRCDHKLYFCIKSCHGITI